MYINVPLVVSKEASMFSSVLIQREPFVPCFEWGSSNIKNLTHFSMLAALVVHCSGGGLLPVFTGFVVGLALVLGWMCWFFFREYLRIRKEMDSFYFDANQAQMFADKLEEYERREAVSIKAVKAIKKALQCPITLCVPKDPVISPSGRVYSRQAMDEYAGKIGYYRCPVTRLVFERTKLIRCYPIESICEELCDL
jgi:hypothetical protein